MRYQTAMSFALVASLAALSACSDRDASTAASKAAADTAPVATPSAPAAAPTAAPSFQQSYTLNGESFKVESVAQGTKTRVTITPSGFRLDNKPFSREVDGVVMGAEIGDLDADSHPEIYVYLASSDENRYGSLLAMSSNDGKSMSEITLPDLRQDSVNNVGYQGHDEFAVIEGVLGRRFPLLEGTGDKADFTGKMRQLQYKLEPGEAGWRLRLDRAAEF